MPPTQPPTSEADAPKTVRLHITPLKPELLKVYLAPSVLPLARNISYHTLETFPEKGFGYVDLPEQEAQKIRKKLNGTTLKGSKVRIDMAKPEKRKVPEDAEAAPEDKPSKRAKKDKKEKKDKSEKRKRDPGVFDGVELPDDRKVKRGWTEPISAKSKSKDKKDKKDKRTKHDKHQPKPSKYTKEPELLFKAKLEPVAATEHSRKEKKDKKEKKERNTKTKEVIVHEFEKNTKTPSFLKVAKVSTEKKPPVEYVNGLGWVDEDGAVVEPETKKAAHSRVLQLVDGQQLVEPPPTDSQGRPIVKAAPPPTDSQGRPLKPVKKQKPKKATPPPESDAESDAESSVVSSSSEDEPSSSESESEDEDDDEGEDAASPTPSPVQTKPASRTSQPTSEPPTSTEAKEVHPLEALFKRAPPTSLSTPTKPPPINTSFSFFDNETTSPSAPAPSTEATEGAPTTPFTQRDLEWRGLRSAAPTPDTAAIGRRFSFDWRNGSQEADDDDDDDDDDEMGDVDAHEQAQLHLNTRANTQSNPLAAVPEERDQDDQDDQDAAAGAADADADADDRPESEFRKWFWEKRGDINRAWKKRRREALKAKRHADNRKMTGGKRVV